MSKAIFIFFLLCTLFLNAQVTKPASTIYKPLKISTDSERKTYTYDNSGNNTLIFAEKSNNGTWENFYKISYTYDSSGNMLTELEETWDLGTWVNTSRHLYTHDNSGNLTQNIYQLWGTGDWINDSKYDFIYNQNTNKVITYIYETWTNNAWVNRSRNNYTYDNSLNLTVILGEFWLNSSWTNSFIFSYTYSPTNKELTSLFQGWVNNAWVNSDKTITSYDSADNKTEFVSQGWSASASSWINIEKYSYTYENSHLLDYLFQKWISNDWSNIELHTYTYDNSGNKNEDLTLYWDNNLWIYLNKFTFSYDLNGNGIHGESFIWENNLWISSPSTILISYNHGENTETAYGKLYDAEYGMYTDVTNEDISPTSFTLQQNYPNPFNPSTTINYSIEKEGPVKLVIYDALGSKVAVVIDEYKPAGTYSVRFNASNLASGMYLYRLEAGSYSSARKFILLK